MDIKLIMLLAVTLILAACSPQPSGPPAPDLVVTMARSNVNLPLCLGTHTRTGALVEITNQGNADAGAFSLTVNGMERRVEEGLAARTATQIWIEAEAFTQPWTTIDVVADSSAEVAERDEENNTTQGIVVTLTAPPPCTPTPEGTPPA